MAGGGERSEDGGEGLLKRGGGHAGRGEDASAEQRVKGFSGYIDGELLGDRVAAGGVAPLGAGREIEADRVGGGGGGAVENLEECGARGVGGVAIEMGDAETGSVAEEATECDGLGGDAGRGRSGRKGSGRNFPGLEGGVDVGVEGELARIDEREEADGGDGFADGGGLEKRVGGDGCRIAGAGEAVGAGPGDFSVGDDGDADCGDMVNDEAPGDGPRFGGSASESGGRKKAGLDAGDAGGECGLGGGVCGAGSEGGEGEAGEQETHEKLQAEF